MSLADITLLPHGEFAQTLKSLEGRFPGWPYLPEESLVRLVDDVRKQGLEPEILNDLVPVWYYSPDASLDGLLEAIDYMDLSREQILERIAPLRKEFSPHGSRTTEGAELRWLMGQLRPLAIGNIKLAELRSLVAKEVD